MPSTPSGYVLPPEYYAVPGTTIRSTQHNTPLEDLAQGVNDSLARDGSRPATGNLPMNGRKITGLGEGTAAGDAVNFGQIQSVAAPGVVVMYAGTTAPSGSLMCNGAAVSRTAYERLFAAIGTTYGSGDGSTTFNVPNLSGRVVVGVGSAGGLGATGGAAEVALTEPQLPSHTHTGTTSAAGNHSHQYQQGQLYTNVPNSGSVTRGYIDGGGSGPNNRDTEVSGNHTHTFTTNPTGSGQAHNNMQPYVVMNYIIKT